MPEGHMTDKLKCCSVGKTDTFDSVTRQHMRVTCLWTDVSYVAVICQHILCLLIPFPLGLCDIPAL